MTIEELDEIALAKFNKIFTQCSVDEMNEAAREWVENNQ